MHKAIRIKLQKAERGYDPSASHFFGSLAIPGKWRDEMHDEMIFIGQIRLTDIADLDEENRLPHTGMLYFFLDVENSSAEEPAEAVVRWYDGEPNAILDDVNVDSPFPETMDEAFMMEFEPCEPDAAGMKLFGEPSGLQEGHGRLLLQYDPSDLPEVSFLQTAERCACFMFGEDESRLEDVTYFSRRL